MSYSPAPASKISTSTDVSLGALSDGEVLTYSTSKTKWENRNVSSTVSITTVATNYTLAASDAGKVIEVTAAAGITLTLPANVLPIGSLVEIMQLGAGTVTIVAGSGATALTAASLTTRAQYSTIGVRARSATQFVISGDLA